MGNRIFVAETLAHTLPFKERLSWEEFQLLCTDILKTDGRFGDARDFLKQGNAQDGIDIYAIPHDRSKNTVAQCKLENYISPKRLNEIIDKFLKGSFANETSEFILCTNFDFKTAKAELTIAEVREKLKSADVEFILWDKAGIESELRTKPRPQLIVRYFGQEIALAFYGKVYADWITSFQNVKKHQYRKNANYIERTLTPYSELFERQQAYFFQNREKNRTLTDLYEPLVIEDGRRIVMLSTAGFGKTWETENLAFYYSDNGKLNYPIKSYLTDYEGQSIEVLLEQYPNWKDIPKETLLLIFDGLDELPNHHFQTFVNYLNQFVESNPQVSILVSSRYNFYDLTFPPLRDFEVYVLDEFTEADIYDYIAENLPGEQERFLQKLAETGLSEFAANPYYLTRLVRFYKEKTAPFPTSKSKLFERILFEGFDADRNKYRLTLNKAEFQDLAEKVAFCMTVLGKSSLNDEELEAIIADNDHKVTFQRFFLFTKGVAAKKEWAFEHKNLQEYLCALFFQRLPFDEVKRLVCFSHAPDKLQPWFHNTMSFLFSAADAKLFERLFSWLNDSQPEIMIRFEKERMPKDTRFEILRGILEYYGVRDLSFYGSSNFTVEELANFVEIDKDVIEYLQQKLFDFHTTDWMAYDIISLLSECRRSYVYKQQLTEIILKAILTRSHFSHFTASCIRALIKLGFWGEETVASIINSGIDFQNFEVRNTTVRYLDKAGLAEVHIDFVLGSLPVYEEGQRKISHYGVNEELRSIIAELKEPTSIKKALQKIIADPDLISDGYSSGKVYLNFEEVSGLLNNAQQAYVTDKSILPLVYRILAKTPHLSFHDELAVPFKRFFEHTGGNFRIFKKFYKYDRNGRDIMLFIDQQGLDFLLDEYRTGNISDLHMEQFRNQLSYANRPLFLQFQTTLESEFGTKFTIEDLGLNYGKLKLEYIEKNQTMLIDPGQFFEEADKIFSAIGKPELTRSDLYSSGNRELLKFQYSSVIQTLRTRSSDKPQNQQELIGNLKIEENWNWFKINAVCNLLQNKNDPPVISTQLIDYAKTWCLNDLHTLDYSNAIQESGINNITFNRRVEFNNKLFGLIDLKVEDNLLLKMLPSDFSGGLNRGQLGLSRLIIDKVVDKELLKTTVLTNIENELPSWVLKTHFAICHYLQYSECLPKLYDTIVNNEHLESDQVRLTNYYLDLGGRIQDFHVYLDTAPVAEHYTSWRWHLLEKAKDTNPELAVPILLNVLDAPDQPQINKIHACRILMQLNKIEALLFWRDFILTNRVLPFDHHQDVIIQHAPAMAIEDVLPVLMDVLDFTYVNNLHETLRFPDSIEDALYTILHAVGLKNVTNFREINRALESKYRKFSGASFARHIEFQRERITQDFYKQQAFGMSLIETIASYQHLKFITNSTSPKPQNWIAKNRDWVISAIVALAILLLSILAHVTGLL